jgi:hypothetical protein
MKANPIFCCGLGALILTVATVLASRPVNPPSRSQVVGVWSGYSDHLDFLRLELDDNGAGYLCVGWVSGDKPELYRVQRWAYSEWNLDLSVVPLDPGAEPVYLTNTVCGYEDLKCGFGGKDWRRKATLVCEREWNLRSKPLAERIAAYRKIGK